LGKKVTYFGSNPENTSTDSGDGFRTVFGRNFIDEYLLEKQSFFFVDPRPFPFLGGLTTLSLSSKMGLSNIQRCDVGVRCRWEWHERQMRQPKVCIAEGVGRFIFPLLGG
jgi:hypothetical protein